MVLIIIVIEIMVIVVVKIIVLVKIVDSAGRGRCDNRGCYAGNMLRIMIKKMMTNLTVTTMGTTFTPLKILKPGSCSTTGSRS